jgi:hypothetical protein
VANQSDAWYAEEIHFKILRDTRQAEMEKINNISKSPLFADKH